MSTFSKLTKVSVAAGSAKPIPLSMSHRFTLGFGNLVPVYNLRMYPGESVSVTPDVFARLAPMVLPPFADCTFKLHAFFVPYRIIWRPYNDFVGQTPYMNANGQQITYKKCPSVTSRILQNLFVSDIYAPTSLCTRVGDGLSYSDEQAYFFAVSEGSAPAHDFSLTSSVTGNVILFRFTQKGKFVYQILNSLGYSFNFGLVDNVPLEALDLLCFFRAYVDWFVPSQLQSSNPLHGLLMRVLQSSPDVSGNIPISAQYLLPMFEQLFDWYDNDYFSSAWVQPNSPDGSNRIITESATDSTVYGYSSSEEIGLADVETGDRAAVTTYEGLTLLQRLAAWVRRNNFAGSRAVERIMARFGVRVPDAVIDYTEFLGQFETPLRVQDVTSQGSDLTNLGEYAGKGWINQDQQSLKTFNYEAKETGLFFIVASVVPNTTFLTGQRREVQCVSPTDFYTPEYDGTLLQAIRGNELFSRNCIGLAYNNNMIAQAQLRMEDSFGFIQRYAECKRSLDQISGDFDVMTLRNNIDGFLLDRRYFTFDGSYKLVRTGLNDGLPASPITILRGDDEVQYNRIFKDTSGFADPFYFSVRFNVIARRKCLPPNDAAELFGRGNDYNTLTNGSRVN